MTSSYTNAKIIGVQFGLLSPEEIERSSVAEITSNVTYVNNLPVINGLFDPRMGVMDPGFICPTDGLINTETPGYAGHIKLARPVFLPQFLPTVVKILRCVCIKCSKLLICKEKHKQALKLQGESRFKYVFSNADTIKCCGDDIENGCNFARPKIKKESGLAAIYAKWKKKTETTTVKLTAEMVLKIFKRICDDDIYFMGFSPIFSRPEWMICVILPISPPAVRPSVIQDSQQRSDDDLTHILVNIVKTNNSLLQKIQSKADEKDIDNMTELVLQYYIAAQVDNKMPGVCSIAQRSGRPYKSIKDRLNGKLGRMRGNIQGKRVNFSARTVITAEPNISLTSVGIPLKIAMNITVPVTVNDINKYYLKSLVMNGADKYPGAKKLQKKNGDEILLRHFTNRESLILENGDIVHRHMIDDDDTAFNRQPSLHRMSIMGHRAKIMKKGNTFRVNLGVTKCYNADFDGDEMNLHIPQSNESSYELRGIAYVAYNIISPAKNAPIIGIFQDSLLGIFLFTNQLVEYDLLSAMNLLVNVDFIIPKETLKKKTEQNKTKTIMTNYEILSEIFPPLSLLRLKKSNLQIKNGQFIQGQMDKSALGEGTNGIIHRINNDFGPQHVVQFIDNLQNVVTKFMHNHSFSCGISDLISDPKTDELIANEINKKKRDVNTLIEQVRLGVFENNSGKTNMEEFEMQVNNILNQASNDAGKIGLDKLHSNNRFVQMVKSGSKGTDLNISFMISCLGQQNVSGKRIPCGFQHRTLPHFTKYNDLPEARGFVQQSYIKGLSPEELFFHAMGGREGLIDTAVKTATTGYIQRRLVKALEDLVVMYDMTVRNNKQIIVQFKYGDDHFDSIKIENQYYPLVDMNYAEIYAHFIHKNDKETIQSFKHIFPSSKINECNHKDYRRRIAEMIEMMIVNKQQVITNVFRHKNENKIHLPVSFVHIIENLRQQMKLTPDSIVDLSLYEAMVIVDTYYEKLNRLHYCPPNDLFKSMYYFYLCPNHIVLEKRFHKKALIFLLETIIITYQRALVSPGEMVGITGGQSIGEISTQMTLNTFHFAGVSSKSNVTRGVARMEEVMSLTSKMKNPSASVFLLPEDEINKSRALTITHMLEHTNLQQIVDEVQICFDPNDDHTLIEEDIEFMKEYREFNEIMNIALPENHVDEITKKMKKNNSNAFEKSKWIIRMKFNRDIMLEKNITMDDVNYTIASIYGDQVFCAYSDYNCNKLIFRIRLKEIFKKSNKTVVNKIIDQSDEIYKLKAFQDELMKNVVIRGVENIDKVMMRKIKDILYEENGSYVKKDIWMLDTVGSNLLDILSLDYIDSTRTISNDIMEVYDIFGIEAARKVIYDELIDVIEYDGTYVNNHIYTLLVDRMTFTHKLISIFRHGINNDDVGPIAKASFEETPEMFLQAARHGEMDNMRGISANVMCGQEGYYGTSAFKVLLDTNQLLKNQENSAYVIPVDENEIEKQLLKDHETSSSSSTCSIHHLSMSIDANHIQRKPEKIDDRYEIVF